MADFQTDGGYFVMSIPQLLLPFLVVLALLNARDGNSQDVGANESPASASPECPDPQDAWNQLGDLSGVLNSFEGYAKCCREAAPDAYSPIEPELTRWMSRGNERAQFLLACLPEPLVADYRMLDARLRDEVAEMTYNAYCADRGSEEKMQRLRKRCGKELHEIIADDTPMSLAETLHR